MRARGLKLVMAGVLVGQKVSRPMRARGLKLDYSMPNRFGYVVAPHAGAWIETHGL